MKESLYHFYRNPNYLIIVSLISLLFYGCIVIYSATFSLGMSSEMLTRHLIYIFMGIIIFFILTFLKKETIKDLGIIVYGISLFMLILIIALKYLHIIESPARWIQIGNFTFQPSEFMKISLVLALSKVFSDPDMQKGKMYIYSLTLTLIPILLVMLQPDLGTAIVFIVIFLSMCFISKLGFPYVLLTICLGALFVFLFRNTLFHEYQIKRLTSFLNPEADPTGEGWSVMQALIAIGSGGLFGKGFLKGTQSKMGFLPNTQYSDFIFAVIGEEFGLVGCLVLIILFLVLLLAIFNLASKTDDYFEKLSLIGICCFLAFQIFENIGMNIGIMPVTGIPLPFISYGGSALISNLTTIGIVYNAQINRKSLEF